MSVANRFKNSKKVDIEAGQIKEIRPMKRYVMWLPMPSGEIERGELIRSRLSVGEIKKHTSGRPFDYLSGYELEELD